jgi:hypothetical protein
MYTDAYSIYYGKYASIFFSWEFFCVERNEKKMFSKTIFFGWGFLVWNGILAHSKNPQKIKSWNFILGIFF